VVERILSVRILFITPYVPSPIRVRPFNLIKSLSIMHEISLVSLLVEDYEQAMIKVVPAPKAVLADENIPILYDSVDCISWFLQQEFETIRNPLKKVFVYSELQKMRRYEQRALLDFDQLVITASSDRDKLGELTGQAQSIQVVSNGVDIDYFTLW